MIQIKLQLVRGVIYIYVIIKVIKPYSMSRSAGNICGSYVLGPAYYWNTIITFHKKNCKILKRLTKSKFSFCIYIYTDIYIYIFIYFLHFVVLTCPNVTVAYDNILCVCDMNSISVGAVTWCSDDEIRNNNIEASFKDHMHLRCIFKPQVCHFQIVALIESHGLCNKKFQEKVKES